MEPALRSITVNLDYYREHFIQRLFERYGIIMSDEEYAQLNSMPNKEKQKIYRGIFCVNDYNSIGILNLNGIDIICIYSIKHHLFKTALPKEVASDIEFAIFACFKRTIRPIATMIYDDIKAEMNSVRKDFDTIKDAAIYYMQHSKYPAIQIELFKTGNVSTFRVCHQIQRIVEGRHRTVRLAIEKIAANS